MDTKKLITTFLDRNVLISPSLVDSLHLVDEKHISHAPFPVLTAKHYTLISHKGSEKIDWSVVEKNIVIAEKSGESQPLSIHLPTPSSPSSSPSFNPLQPTNETQNIAPQTPNVATSPIPHSISNTSPLSPSQQPSEPSQIVHHPTTPQPTSHSSNLDYIKKNFPVKVVYSYDGEPRKRDIQDFVSYFRNRFMSLEKTLKNRKEMRNKLSIARINAKKDRETVSFVGLVSQKQITKNGNLMLTVEDLTGSTRILVNKNKQDIFSFAQDIVLDEVIGIIGTCAENIVFVNDLLAPDIPLTKELKKTEHECYAVFISDIHVGSKYFLDEEFDKFLDWINGRVGNEQQQTIAKNTKYVFVVGDLIDGVGIYPGQEEELDIKGVTEQYEACAKLLSQIPKDKQIIVCPGNHDAVRIAEPQPVLYEDFAKSIYDLENVTVVANPSLINIHNVDGFPGFDVLMYHGYSFDHYINNVDALRLNGGYGRGDLMMKFLLKRRHLAPTHMSTAYIPDSEQDPLVISHIPDFFVTGHIHYSIAANYRNVSLICCSCWQGKTLFQEKLGHEPQPARVPVVNLSTREIKILRFGA